MKTVEASTIHEGIEQTTKLLSELANQVAEVHGKITGILNTESDFSGQAASSIRAFYKDIHAPLAVYLEGIVRDYHDILRQIQQLLYELDSSEHAYIDEDFLKSEMERQLKKAKEQTAQLTDETNDILRSVRDIIHLSDVSDDQFIHSVEKTESKVNKTIEKLHQFDQEATHKLTTTENDVDLLENYLSDIQSLTKDRQLIMTSYQANSITQLDVHQQMIAGLVQKTIPKDFVLDIFRSITNSSYLAMGNTAASIVRAQLNDTMSMTMNYRMRALATIVDTTSPVMLGDEFKSLDAKVVSSQSVRDYKGEYYGNYLTLQDGRVVRSFMDHDGVMKYHFVGDIPEERLKPVEEDKSLLSRFGSSFMRTVDSTYELGKDTVQGLGNHFEELNDNKMNSFYDFANYLTVGALDGGKNTYNSMVGYSENMLNSPADFANWVTMGGVDLAEGAFNPDDPNSKEHIAHVISMGMFMFIRKPSPKADISTPNSKSTGAQAAPKQDKDSPSTNATVSSTNTYVPGKLPTLTNIREWFRVRMPEVGLVQDATGAYHLAKTDTPRGGRSSGSSNEAEISMKKKGSGDGDSIDGVNVIDGKIGGKIPAEDFKQIRDASLHNVDTNSMTLGKYTPTIEKGVENWGKAGSDSYIGKAGKDSMYFDLGSEWGTIQKKYALTDDEMFNYFNIPALDDAVMSGKQIRFSHNPGLKIYEESYLAQEWKYLQSKYGFDELIKEGDVWIAN